MGTEVREWGNQRLRNVNQVWPCCLLMAGLGPAVDPIPSNVKGVEFRIAVISI